jgi:hypothetical protein
LEPLAFDEYCRFVSSAFFWGNKEMLALFSKRKQKYQNGNIHRKLKVPTSVISCQS